MVIDFTPVHDARLLPSELAKLCKVSRVTASFWMNGHKQPHHLLTERVTLIVDDISRAVQAGLLPLSHDVSRRERLLGIQSAIEKAKAVQN